MQIITQASFSDPPKSARLSDDPLVVHQRPNLSHNERLIILVPGLGGRRYGRNSTWSKLPHFLFDDLPDIDLGLYFYSTLMVKFAFWKSIDLRKEAKILANVLRDAPIYDRFLLIGHSMGGLLCKAAIHYLLLSNELNVLHRVRGLLLIATPQIGSLRVPGFLGMISHDFYALKVHGLVAREINLTFISRLNLDATITVPGKIQLPTWSLYAASDIWVDELSANIGVPAGQRKLVRGSHRTVVKPPAKTSDEYRFIRAVVETCLTADTGQAEQVARDDANTRASLLVDAMQVQNRRALAEMSQLGGAQVGFEASTIYSVYVPRADTERWAVEGILSSIALTERGQGLWICVRGEAGVGKTSLLVRLFRELSAVIDKKTLVLILRATDVSLIFQEKAIFPGEPGGTWGILQVVDTVTAAGHRVVVFIDTLDVLLYTLKTEVCDFIRELQDSGATVLSTCRSLEFAMFNVSPSRQKLLADFAPPEADAALELYVRHYYHAEVAHSELWILQRLRRMRDEQLAFERICRNPLTLRMAFEAHVPDMIPQGLNTSRLYERFWDRKVASCMHYVAYSPVSVVKKGMCLRLAATMVERRSLQLGSDVFMMDFGDAWGDLEADAFTDLLSEGVIYDRDGRIEFFHQSVLEYVEAKRLLTGPSGGNHLLRLVDEQDRTPDLFLLAIIKQGAVQAPTDTRDRILEALFASQRVASRRAGLEVFSRLEQPSPAEVRLGEQHILNSNIMIEEFLESLADFPRSRWSEVLRLLDAVWQRRDKRLARVIISALEELASISPSLVLDILATTGKRPPSGWVADPRPGRIFEPEDSQSHNSYRRAVVRLLRRIAESNPSEAKTLLEDIYAQGDHDTRKLVISVLPSLGADVGLEYVKKYFTEGVVRSTAFAAPTVALAQRDPTVASGLIEYFIAQFPTQPARVVAPLQALVEAISEARMPIAQGLAHYVLSDSPRLSAASIRVAETLSQVAPEDAAKHILPVLVKANEIVIRRSMAALRPLGSLPSDLVEELKPRVISLIGKYDARTTRLAISFLVGMGQWAFARIRGILAELLRSNDRAVVESVLRNIPGLKVEHLRDVLERPEQFSRDERETIRTAMIPVLIRLALEDDRTAKDELVRLILTDNSTMVQIGISMRVNDLVGTQPALVMTMAERMAAKQGGSIHPEVLVNVIHALQHLPRSYADAVLRILAQFVHSPDIKVRQSIAEVSKTIYADATDEEAVLAIVRELALKPGRKALLRDLASLIGMMLQRGTAPHGELSDVLFAISRDDRGGAGYSLTRAWIMTGKHDVGLAARRIQELMPQSTAGGQRLMMRALLRMPLANRSDVLNELLARDDLDETAKNVILNWR